MNTVTCMRASCQVQDSSFIQSFLDLQLGVNREICSMGKFIAILESDFYVSGPDTMTSLYEINQDGWP